MLVTDASKYSSVQDAINFAEFVYIPVGTYTGNIVCRESVDVRLARGAVINGNVQLAKYMSFSGGWIKGNVTCVSPCVGATLRDTRLSGNIELNVTGSYINNNVFENIWMYAGEIYINAHGNTGEVSGNSFRIFHQPIETSQHLLEIYGQSSYNDFYICSLDWGNVSNLVAAILDNQTFYNRLHLTGNIDVGHIQNSGSQNAITIARNQ